MMLMIIVSVYLFTREVGQQLEGRSFGNLLAGKIFGCLLPFFVILMLYQSVVFPNLGTWGNMTCADAFALRSRFVLPSCGV